VTEVQKWDAADFPKGVRADRGDRRCQRLLYTACGEGCQQRAQLNSIDTGLSKGYFAARYETYAEDLFAGLT
jgi:hypothetical protein